MTLARIGTAAMMLVMLAGGAVTSMTARSAQAAQTPAPPPARPATLADLRPQEADDRLFKAPPVVEINPDGTGAVLFDTMVATPAARVSVGTLNPYTALDTPLFPVSIRESITQPASSHRIPLSLRALDAWLPPAAAGVTREADAYVRIEAYDPRAAGARYIEVRQHYAVAGGRYEKRTTVRLGPAIDQVTVSSALVSWSTDVAAVGRVELWSGDGQKKLAEFASAPDPAARQVVRLDGLKPRRGYKYRVLVANQPGGPVITTGRFYSFRTAPSGAGAFTFVFMSDGRPSQGGGFVNFNGVNAAITPRLIADAYRRGSDFALFGGDLSVGYTSSQAHFGMMLDTWSHLVDPVAHEMPIYEGFGNHDSLQDVYRDAAGTRYGTDKLGERSSESEFSRRFTNPENGPEPEVLNGVTGPPYKGTVYSFDYGNSHFVMLNNDYWLTSGGPAADRSLALKLLGGNRNGYLMTNQLAWLERDLAEARKRGAVHVFVAAHEPVWPVGGHVADAMWWNGLDDPSLPAGDVVSMRNRFLAIVDRYRVTALLFGHEHVYARLAVDRSVDPIVTRPLVQFVSGGAGAPFYAQDESAPWAKAVKTFAAVNHYLLFTVAGREVRFEAIDLDGRVFDKGIFR